MKTFNAPLAIKLINVSRGGPYSLLGADLAIGTVEDGRFVGRTTISRLWYRESKGGKKYVEGPWRWRMKDGQKVPDPKNPQYNLKDEHYSPFAERGANPRNPDGLGITPAGWEFNDAVIALFEEALQERGSEEAGRGTATATALPASASGDDVTCPKCGGAMWDNRVGKKNPKAPDFKCRDRGCDGVIWPPRDAAPTPASKTPLAAAATRSGPPATASLALGDDAGDAGSPFGEDDGDIPF